MKNNKFFLRKKFLLKREKNYLKAKKFNFNLIFKLINKHFNKKKIIIAGYYPSNYEVNILKFLENANKKNFKVGLPVITSSNNMIFKLWNFKEPLCVNKFGILEPQKENKEILPDLVMAPLVAYDAKLNRIGHGKGYYDKNLNKMKKIKKNLVTLGIAYSFQKCSTIPTNKYDVKLNYIFTENGIISSR